MILVDTSVWIDHFRRRSDALARLLENGGVYCHPFVVGELACGNLANRATILPLLEALPQVPTADHHEVLTYVEKYKLMGRGIGWIDAHLLASAQLAGAMLWTTDRRLARVAQSLGLLAAP